ncbi:hypothetical protein KIN20_022771 [Parelaphostrongylus tenuis]|uniref:Uncharacterized protein n=1 Tax=Parelaphostrongylus tenuis TaxID=148309 RepID=A0AAD5N6G0_PARTN|nr:hypothetical protein KIN20_022771 [Parelaphostrongylus tenuis]
MGDKLTKNSSRRLTARSSYYSQELETMMSEINKPVRNPAPRGKRFLSLTHARYCYFDISEECIEPDEDTSHTCLKEDGLRVGCAFNANLMIHCGVSKSGFKIA